MLLLLTSALAGPAQTVGPYDPARSFAPLVEAVAPAVVLVEIETPSKSGTDHHSGSGFLLSEDGLVLTANHVVQEVTAITVTTHDGEQVSATIVGSDAAMDIALLRLAGDREWPWLALGDSARLRVGDRVLALGNPLGLGATVTAGIVSGTGRNLELDRYWRSDDFIQTDAAINQGNSGGPLVDLDGKVVGMNTSIIAGANTVGFAVPALLLERVVPELRDHGQVLRGFLGLDANKLTEQAAEKYGVPNGGALVFEVRKGGPAATAGIHPRDVIIAVDGTPIRTGADLLASVGNRRPGDQLRITLLRHGKERTVDVVLGRRPKE